MRNKHPYAPTWLVPVLAVSLAAAISTDAAASILSGRVIGPGAVPAPGVDIDVDDALTGERIPTVSDTTDADGTFDIEVPDGIFHVTFNAPKPLRLVSRTLVNVSVGPSQTDLGDVPLQRGVLVSGRAIRLSNGSAVANADTDIDDSHSGFRIPTPDDDTDGSGAFSIVAPIGTIDLTIEPSKADRLVALRLVGLDVGGDVNLGNLGLGVGFLVSGTAATPGGPLAGVDVEAYDAATGAEIPTPSSTSGAGGAFSFVVPAGTYDFKASAPIETATGRSVLANVTVNGDVSTPVNVFSTPVSIRFDAAGRLADAGSIYRAFVRVRNNTGAPRSVRAIVTVSDPRSGKGRFAVAPFDTTLPGSFAIQTGRIALRIPSAVRPAFRGVPIHLLAALVDPTTSALLDSDFLAFEIR